EFVTYYFIWIGLSSVVDSYTGTPSEDPDAFLAYLRARPAGSVTILWNVNARTQTFTGLDSSLDYTVAVTPVSAASSITHIGLPAILPLEW
ncbi:MAG: hypothetical protein II636_07010, partial [Bacteroidales bacterium]|nr:hypothetical protein [Bacteroidales bacterium]